MDAVNIVKLSIVASIFLTALGYGLQTPFHEAFSLFRKPGQLLRSLVAMNVIMPLLAILMAVFTDLSPVIKTALVAISVSPLPPLFPRKPLQAGGHHDYVTGLMVAVSLLSVILIPLTLEILARVINKPIQISIMAIAKAVLSTVIVPLIIGIGIRYFAEAFARKVAGPVARFAQILLIVSILPLLFVLFPEIWRQVGNGSVLAIAAFVVAGLVTGLLLGGPDQQDRTVLAYATAARHPGVAIAVAAANLPDQKQVAAAVFLYLLVNAIVTIPYLKWTNHRKIPAPI